MFKWLQKPFYTEAQKYSINYRVMVKNLASDKNNLHIILPLPSNNQAQTLLERFKLAPLGILKREKKFNNLYAYWKVVLEKNSSQTFEANFKIEVHPINNSLNKSFKLSDYQKKDIRKYLKFLKSDKYMDSKNKKIQSLARKLVGQEKSVAKILNILNNYVINHLDYGNPISGLYTTEEALSKDKVDCGGFDVLLGALCKALGIPVRIVSGFWAGYKENGMHAWLEILLPDGVWIPTDPSIEYLSKMGRTKKFARLGFVGSDRIAFSQGNNFSLKLGKKLLKIDILQNPVILAVQGKTSFQFSKKFETNIIK